MNLLEILKSELSRTLIEHGSRLQVSSFKKKVFYPSHLIPEFWNLKPVKSPYSHLFLPILMVLTLVMFFLHGCGASEPIRYYQLSSILRSDTQGAAAGEKRGTIIGIGPVDIPRYVDRLQIVTRSAPNVVDLAEFDRWAEPVQTDVKRVLVENITELLSGDQAAVIFWDEGLPLNYQVRIEVTRFDFERSGEATLYARWILVGKDERHPLVLRTSRFNQSAQPGDFASLVGAMSRNLELLSQEIVSAIKPLL